MARDDLQFMMTIPLVDLVLEHKPQAGIAKYRLLSFGIERQAH